MELGAPGVPFKTTPWTMCLPRFCIYEAACPVKGPRQRTVETRDCFRYAPLEKRPPSRLSPFAREMLERLQSGAQLLDTEG